MGDSARLERWLGLLASRNGSDLLLVAGAPPSIRVDSKVIPLAEGPLDGLDIEEAVLPALAPHARRQYRDVRIADASFRISGIGRFRINLHRERGRAAAAVRLLPARVPRLATLGLPPTVELLAQLPRGLVLVGGPTGSGKTTTLAAIVEEINRRDARHIVTIEDPIEYEHQHSGSLIEQVEIGVDAPDFPDRPARRRASGAGRDRRRRNARSGDDADRARRGRDRPPGPLDDPHNRRGVVDLAHRRLVSARAPEHHSTGDGDGARRGADADAAAAARRRALRPPPSC